MRGRNAPFYLCLAVAHAHDVANVTVEETAALGEVLDFALYIGLVSTTDSQFITRLKYMPSNGILRCRVIFNGERLIITSPTALSQIATDTFTFVKPNVLRLLAQRVLGLGLVLVNREVHRQ